MGQTALTDEFESLSSERQIRLVQDLWDRIAQRPADVAVPAWHTEELARRLDEHERFPDDVVAWDTVRARLLKPKR